jgi:hypothetical protein
MWTLAECGPAASDVGSQLPAWIDLLVTPRLDRFGSSRVSVES